MCVNYPFAITYLYSTGRELYSCTIICVCVYKETTLGSYYKRREKEKVREIYDIAKTREEE